MEKKYLVHFRPLFPHLATQTYKTFKGEKEKQTFKREENRRQHK